MTINKNGTKKVYTKKSFAQNTDIFRPVNKLKVHSKLEAIKKPTKYSNIKVMKQKVSVLNLSSSGPVKRGPGRPKKVLKSDDGNNNDQVAKEKRLKLDCSSKIKHKTSSSSSSDLSPPVLEPWSPFSPRKDSTHTPPTLSPASSVAKQSDQKSSDDDKIYQKKIMNKRTPSTMVCKILNVPYFYFKF